MFNIACNYRVIIACPNDHTNIRKAWKQLGDKLGITAADAKKSLKDRFTWHHLEDCKTLILVDRAVHAAVPHSGGNSMCKALKEAGY